MKEETSGRNLTDGLIFVFGKWLENPDSPYVWAPLGLCLLFFVVFIPTGEPLTLYAGLALGIITLGADWIGRRQNRKLPPVHQGETTAEGEEEIKNYLQEALSRSETLREKGKLAAADNVIGNAFQAVTQELAQLGGQYEQIRATEPSDAKRMWKLEDQVITIQEVAGRIAQSAIIQLLQPGHYLAAGAGEPGKRIVGLSLLEKYPDVSYFDQVLDKVTNSVSAFEQYHALLVLEMMVPYLGQDECERLDAALAGQMSAGGKRQIEEGTDRYLVAMDIRQRIKSTLAR